MNWSYYLSYVSSIIRPLEADMSFVDFKRELMKGVSADKNKGENRIAMNKKQINDQVSKAEEILKGFVPVKKEGVQ